MSIPTDAKQAYDYFFAILQNPADSRFFKENPDQTDLLPAASAVAQFVIERPAILVLDGSNPGLILELVQGEIEEAREAKEDSLPSELYDVVFFALLSGLLHYEQLDEKGREFVVSAIRDARELAQPLGLNLSEGVMEIAGNKDTKNYPKEFYAIQKGETVEELVPRAKVINKTSHALRKELNGKLEGVNIIETLHLIRTSLEDTDPVAENIDLLFTNVVLPVIVESL